MQQQTLFSVQSMSGLGTSYSVDLDKRTCTCPAFLNKYAFQGKPCKHLLKVAMENGINLEDLPITVGKQVSPGGKWCVADVDPVSAYKTIERFSRQRLSKNFIMRDFLYLSEATHRGVGNYPEADHEHVLECGRQLCARVLEPVLEKFGNFAITYGYSNRQHMDWGLSPQQAKKKYNSSNPHHWNRGTFGEQVYARVDITPYCVVDKEVTKKEFGHWLMHNLDIDLLMQWERSNTFCITIGPRPRRVWLEWVQGGTGEGGSNKKTFMGVDYWENKYPFMPVDKRPKYGPSMSGGKMWWG